jgi:hypothetical protein
MDSDNFKNPEEPMYSRGLSIPPYQPPHPQLFDESSIHHDAQMEVNQSSASESLNLFSRMQKEEQKDEEKDQSKVLSEQP